LAIFPRGATSSDRLRQIHEATDEIVPDSLRSSTCLRTFEGTGSVRSPCFLATRKRPVAQVTGTTPAGKPSSLIEPATAGKKLLGGLCELCGLLFDTPGGSRKPIRARRLVLKIEIALRIALGSCRRAPNRADQSVPAVPAGASLGTGQREAVGRAARRGPIAPSSRLAASQLDGRWRAE
jgi:hypothetical protein